MDVWEENRVKYTLIKKNLRKISSSIVLKIRKGSGAKLPNIWGNAWKFSHIWGDNYTVKKAVGFPAPNRDVTYVPAGDGKTGNLFLQCSLICMTLPLINFPLFLTVYLFVCARPRDNYTYLNTHTHIQGRMPRKAVCSAQLLSGSRPLLRYSMRVSSYRDYPSFIQL